MKPDTAPDEPIPGYALKALLRCHSQRCQKIAARLDAADFEPAGFEASRLAGALRQTAADLAHMVDDVAALETRP